MTQTFHLLIVEDENVIQQRLQRQFTTLLQQRGLDIQIDCAGTLTQAKNLLLNNRFDLISLDLNLSGESGFELLQLSCCNAGHTVIVSAYRDQAVYAFEYGVLDFVPKPFSQQRLQRTLERLWQRQPINEATTTKFLLIKNGAETTRIDIEEVESISGYGNYSKVHLSNGQEQLHEKGLDNLLCILPQSFMRVHKSHILHLDKLQSLRSLGAGKYEVITYSNRIVPVGRSKIDSLRTRLAE